MSGRHVLIRGADGRLRVVNEYTGVSAGVLAADALPQPQSSGPAFIWSFAVVMFALGAAAGAIAYRIATW